MDVAESNIRTFPEENPCRQSAIWSPSPDHACMFTQCRVQSLGSPCETRKSSHQKSPVLHWDGKVMQSICFPVKRKVKSSKKKKTGPSWGGIGTSDLLCAVPSGGRGHTCRAPPRACSVSNATPPSVKCQTGTYAAYQMQQRLRYMRCWLFSLIGGRRAATTP